MKNNKNKLKILIINYEHPPLGGGGGVSTQSLAQALVKKGHTVHILTTGIKGLPKKEDEDGVTVFRVPVLFRKDLKTASDMSMFTFPITSIPKGISLCMKFRYDIINTHFYAPTGPTGMLLSLVTGIPNILYIHGADVFDPTRINKTPAGRGLLSFLLRLNARIQNRFAHSITCQSTNTRDNIQAYIQPHKGITVIPLPFNRPEHPSSSRKELGLDENIFYLLTAGRVVKRKGYDFLIKSMTGINDSIHLIIIGDGPELDNLRKLAEELGISQRVHLLGYVEKEEDKFKYYSACDIFVLSSLHEGMGIVLQEAMEFGLPIIATNFGGQVDLIENDKNGILINPKNSEELAVSINSLFLDAEKRDRFGRENTRRIKQYYSDTIAERFLEIFYRYV